MGAGRIDAKVQRAIDHLQFFRNRVWRNGTCADQRRYTVPLCESLWQNEDDQ